MTAAASIWAALSAAGGSLALAFIVALAVGINALTVFYVGSAVVVLERFARVARGWRWPVLFGVIAAGALAAIGLSLGRPETRGLPTAEWWGEWSVAAVGCVLAVTIAMGGCTLALRRLRPARLAEVAVAALAAGYGIVVGATARPLLVAAPLGVALLALAAIEWRRQRRSQPPGEASRLFSVLVVALAVAGGGAWLASGGAPDEGVAAVGAGIVVAWAGAVLVGLLPLAAAGLVEIRRSVEWFIAVRYLVAKRRQVFISAITAICVVGIAAGVWLIIVVLSVMNGFEKTWRDEILGNRAHFTVHSGTGPFSDYQGVRDRVLSVPGVTGASPYIDAEGMVRGDGGRIFSVRVRGIDPSTVGDVTDLRSDLISGSLDDLAQQNGGDPAILIGNHLSLALGAKVGDLILLVSPYGGAPTPLGPAPRLKRFRIAGVFESSFFQYDEVYTYVSLSAAQNFRRAGDVVDGIEARTTDFYRSRSVGDEVSAELAYPFFTRDWKDFFPAFFQALKTERVMMFMLLTMIMVVAAFVIVATLIMMIMEKSSDIAILKAMGAEDAMIERIFAIEGTLIGLAGTAFGVVAGIAVTNQLAWVQERIEAITGIDTLPASVYQFSTLPSAVDPVQVAVVAAIAMILSLGATLLPSRQGSRLDPVEALRYE